jgi:threonine dehydratase
MIVPIAQIRQASQRIKDIVILSKIEKNQRLSDKYGCEVWLKREDEQKVRSFKIRGAYNLISKINEESISDENPVIVCASSGNHAQGVAFSCSHLNLTGKIFMPEVTSNQKIQKVKKIGGANIEIILKGRNYDEAFGFASEYVSSNPTSRLVHPFGDEDVIAGQGTIGLEIYDQMSDGVDYVVCAIGGGGLISGVGSSLKSIDEHIKIIGVEPSGSSSMAQSLIQCKRVQLDRVDTFCDGVAVNRVGEKTLAICKQVVDQVVVVEEGQVATDLIDLYQIEGIITETAGALCVSALDTIQDKIRGKKVVCVICGGNNDPMRYPEILERSLIWQGKKHYFIVDFAQRPGALKLLLNDVLGPNDDIVRFEYIKKNNRESGPALIGIQLSDKDDYAILVGNFHTSGITFQEIKTEDLIYQLLI